MQGVLVLCDASNGTPLAGDEIIVFDSTGTALQDVAAAGVYRRALGGSKASIFPSTRNFSWRFICDTNSHRSTVVRGY
jgi:ornithine cyclodeaminase/alanine dehydrogenase-like protein (mu-crystallin family)